jgi:hypothetical protein
MFRIRQKTVAFFYKEEIKLFGKYNRTFHGDPSRKAH